MSEFSLRELRNDAQLAADGESDGYLIPAGTYEEAVLALVEAVEAVRAWENAQTDPDLAITEDRYRAALARFTDYPADEQTEEGR